MSALHRRTVARRKAELVAYSRRHKQAGTPSEVLLWHRLVNGKLGVSFRRQEVLACRFIADFVAPSLGLVVEVDGAAWHRPRARADARRDEKLRRLGYTVLRIPAKVVERNLPEAVRRVREAVEALRSGTAAHAHPKPCPREQRWSR